MRVLTAGEVAEWFQWCKNLGHEYVHYDSSSPFFACTEAACIDLEYPSKLERLPFFARYVATIGYEDRHFEGALLWFTAWGVWNSTDEAIGYRTVESMHRAAGQLGTFEAGPGHQYRADELSDAVGMLMQPMIFGWDGYYLPRWSYGTDEFFLHVSHDSYLKVVIRTKAFYDRVFQQLEELELNPKRGDEMQSKRFCHPL